MQDECDGVYEDSYFKSRFSPYHIIDRPSYFHYLYYVVAKLNRKNLKWLDVGSGYGYLLDDAEKINKKQKDIHIMPVGFDISTYALKKSKARFKVRGDAHNLPFKESSFDAISAFHVVEHLENPVGMLDECNRVLKQNGLLIIATPYNLTGSSDPHHINENPPKFWIEKLNKTGFRCKPHYLPVMFSCYNINKPSHPRLKNNPIKILGYLFIRGSGILPFRVRYYIEEPARKLLGRFFVKSLFLIGIKK